MPLRRYCSRVSVTAPKAGFTSDRARSKSAISICQQEKDLIYQAVQCTQSAVTLVQEAMGFRHCTDNVTAAGVGHDTGMTPKYSYYGVRQNEARLSAASQAAVPVFMM